MIRRDNAAARKIGEEELSAVRRESRSLYWSVGLFSVFVNLLMLTGPLYMLQVYDRVLGSRSEETLVALSILVVFLYGSMGVLDYARGRVTARIGARFQTRLDARVFQAMLGRSAGRAESPTGPAATGLRDLESVRGFIASPVFTALFDAPFTPLFIFAIFLFHPWLGYLAVGGGAVLIAITVANQYATRGPQADSAVASARSERWSEQMRHDAETVEALGMRSAALSRWSETRGESLREAVRLSDRSGGFTRRHQDLAPVPPVRDAGPRRLPRAAGPAHAGRDDRGLDPAGPGAGAHRTRRRAVVRGAARRQGLGQPVHPPRERARARGRAPRCRAPRPTSRCAT